MNSYAGPSRHDYVANAVKSNKLTSSSGYAIDGSKQFPEEIQADLEDMQAFTSRLSKTTCSRCNAKLLQDFSTAKWYQTWDERQKQKKKPSICASQCNNCRAWTCLGCGKQPIMGKYFAEIRGYYIDWCCVKGRVFAIWALLSRYDNFELKMLPQPQSLRNTGGGPRGNTNQNSGTGYNSVQNNGLSYYDYQVMSGRVLDFTETDAKVDDITKTFFAMITRLLPLYAGESAPTGLANMIELSLFQERAAQLLRNDSIKDAQTHGSLYRYLLDFVMKIGTHKDTRFLVADSRYVKKKSPGLEHLSFGDSIGGTRDTPYGKRRATQLLEVDRAQKWMSSSLLDSMKNLAIQSDALLRTSRGVTSSFGDASGQEMLALAKHVSSLYKTLGTGVQKTKALASHLTWETFCEEHRVTYVGHNQILANLSTIKGMQSAARSLRESPRGRLKAITLQLADLHTSLPDGILIKAQEDRPDIMKCLIVGPDDTPYEGGLFEFDIFCPVQFPIESPKLRFRTTYSGRVRFNPNLHYDGEVCLSILGTHPGSPAEQWQPNKSTLLQVLVSIQAMIFTSEPFFNEPGEESKVRGTYAKSMSAQYNRLRQAWTVRFAMIDWLNDPKMRDGIWKNEIAKYYGLNGSKVLATVRKWASENSQIINYQGQGTKWDQSLFSFMRGQNLFMGLENAVASFQKREER